MTRTAISMRLLLAYGLLLVHLTLFRFPQPGAGSNLVPLATVAQAWTEGGRSWQVNVLGNLAAFMPLGFLLTWLNESRLTARRVFLISTGVSLSIETLQFLSGRRVADIDDVWLNALGGLGGYAAAIGIGRLRIRFGSVAAAISSRSG